MGFSRELVFLWAMFCRRGTNLWTDLNCKLVPYFIWLKYFTEEVYIYLYDNMESNEEYYKRDNG